MNNYLKRLVELAEEIKDIQDDKGGYNLNKYDVIRSKTNYLVGYILASKDLSPDQGIKEKSKK